MRVIQTLKLSIIWFIHSINLRFNIHLIVIFNLFTNILMDFSGRSWIQSVASTSQRGPRQQWACSEIAIACRSAHLRQLQHKDLPPASGTLLPYSTAIHRLLYWYKVCHGSNNESPAGYKSNLLLLFLNKYNWWMMMYRLWNTVDHNPGIVCGTQWTIIPVSFVGHSGP